jgi:hypothetical protein
MFRTGVANIYRCKANGTSGATRPSHTSGEASDGTVTWATYNEPYVWTSGSDNDIVLFDEDLMIEGMVWAYRRAKDMPFEPQKLEWENAVRTAAARFQGATRISAADDDEESADWPNIPGGSWSV